MSDVEQFLQARDFLLAHRTDYETAYREFHRPVLEKFNWALDYFDVMARGNDKSALWIVEESGEENKLTFAEISARSNQVANWLRSQGVRRGDRVLMMLGNEIALWETMLAVIKLGAVMIPATILLNEEDLRDRMERGRVKHVVINSNYTNKFDGIEGDYTRIAVCENKDGWKNFSDSKKVPEDFTPDGETNACDPLLLYFTSGTTDKPKLVLHTQQSYPVGHLSTMYWIGIQADDVHMNISSPGWAKHAWSSFFAPWNACACIFVYNYTRFDAAHLLAALERYGITTMCAPPTVWRMLIQEDLTKFRGRLKLKELVGAGEPLNPEVINQVKAAWGITIRDGFGQTETSAQIGNSPGQLVKPGSMGRPLPGYEVVLIDHDGNPANEGEIALKLDSHPLGLMQCYAGDENKNAEAMQDGLYRTGDVASMDEDGYITYVGRADDVFKSSDYRISPFELESVLIEHPAIAEAAVVPSPDEMRLSVPKAFIILRSGYNPSKELAKDIFAFLREHLAPYKRIRRLEFSDLPKTISGKIRRVELRANEAKHLATKERNEWEFFETDFPDLKKQT